MTAATLSPTAPLVRPARHVVLALILAALAMAPTLAPLPPAIRPLAPLAIAVLPFAGLIAFSNPFALCLAFVIFSFFRIHEAFPALGPLHIPQLIAIPTLMVLCWHVLVKRSIELYWSRLLTIFAIFFVFVTLGLPFAVSRPEAVGFYTANYWKVAIMTLAIAWLTRRPRDFAIASHAFVVAGVLIAGVAIYNRTHGIGLVEGTRVTIGRDIQSLLGDPNDLSLVLLFPLSFAVSLFARRTSWLSALFGMAASVAIVVAIIDTQSRGGLLGLMTVFAVYGARMIKSKALLITIAVVAAMALFAAAGISGRQSGGSAETDNGIDESSMGRIYAWHAAWNMALARPLNGVGLNNFVINYFFYSPHWDGHNHAVHSTWFDVLGTTGFPGIIAFVAMVVTVIRMSFLALRKLESVKAPMPARAMGHAVLAGVAGFCVSGTFLTQGFTWSIYVLVALGTAIAEYARRLPDSPQGAKVEASRGPAVCLPGPARGTVPASRAMGAGRGALAMADGLAR
ncbi:O-antigen ligase [Roseiarcus fermentans]|uniref:O-antigen ligase n=1 Tax=Roseiarcus fermentans TaxID=1473586 RepID=A0A366FN89_9HYPH|nr:O-antigen ligase family protein [Roseiarcus fermentans]RBP16102.1 O-antigen ligase [Roseiarcus fermentans]